MIPVNRSQETDSLVVVVPSTTQPSITPRQQRPHVIPVLEKRIDARRGRDDMKYTVNTRHPNSVLSCPYDNIIIENLINVYQEFISYYENETSVGLVHICTNTESFSFI